MIIEALEKLRQEREKEIKELRRCKTKSDLISKIGLIVSLSIEGATWSLAERVTVEAVKGIKWWNMENTISVFHSVDRLYRDEIDFLRSLARCFKEFDILPELRKLQKVKYHLQKNSNVGVSVGHFLSVDEYKFLLRLRDISWYHRKEGKQILRILLWKFFSVAQEIFVESEKKMNISLSWNEKKKIFWLFSAIPFLFGRQVEDGRIVSLFEDSSFEALKSKIRARLFYFSTENAEEQKKRGFSEESKRSNKTREVTREAKSKRKEG